MKKNLIKVTIILSMLLLTLIPLSASAATTVNVSTISDFQSAHPYSNYENTTWIYNHSTKAESLEITFSSDTETEVNYDFIFIYDGNGNQIGKYSGQTLANQTIKINGNSVQIKLTSDGSVEKSGFKVINIKANEPVPETKFYRTTTRDGALVQFIDYHEKSDNTIFVESARLDYTGIIPEFIDGNPVTEIGTNSIYKQGNSGYRNNVIVIPKTITKINKNALCHNKLDEIVYLGTEEEWNKIDIDAENELLFSTPLIFGKKYNSFCYYINDNSEIIILECDKSVSGKVSIPSEIEGFSVSGVASFAFWNCNEMTELYIPDSVKFLDPFAIDSCQSLVKVSYPKNIQMNVYEMFYLSRLECLYVPDGTTYLGYLAVSSVKELIVPNTVTYIEGDNLEYNVDKIKFLGTEDEWKQITFCDWNDFYNSQYHELADSKVIFVPNTKTQILNGIFLVKPTNVENGNRIIFTYYNGNKLVYANPYVYAGETTIPFSTPETYDEVKVMVWENSETCVPLCEAENVPLN